MTLLAWNQWFLGPNQAINANRSALTTALQEADHYSQALGLVFSTLLLRMLRVPDGGLAQAERALAVATQQDSPLLAAEARVERGAALVDHGRSDEGFAELRRGMSEYEAHRRGRQSVAICPVGGRLRAGAKRRRRTQSRRARS